MPATNVFDAQCYLARYPDLRGNKSASKDPRAHWLKFGQSEGRVPGCDIPGTLYSTVFNSNAYLARYADIRQSPKYASQPFLHWQDFGAAESRHPGYELIIPGVTPSLTDGVVSPGTVQIQDTNANSSVENGTITNSDINTLLNSATDTAHTGDGTNTATPATTANPEITDNSKMYMIAGAAALLLIVMTKSKRKKSNRKK